MTKTRGFPSREAWRLWLAKNHAAERELFVIFDKARTGRRTLRYEEAVEEAICFGWIDGVRKRFDADRFLQRFSPRRTVTSWSRLNLERAKKMIAAGRMMRAGRDRLGDALLKYQKDGVAKQPPRVDQPPAELEVLLKSHPSARRNIEALPPSRRREYLGWIVSAKRAETRQRRIQEVLTALARGRPLGLK